MSFGLKNTGPTYQRLVNKVFKEGIWNTMEVYVDDMLVENSTIKQHVKDLRKTCLTLKAHKIMLNHREMYLWHGSRKITGVHGFTAWNRSQSRENKSNIRDDASQEYKRNSMFDRASCSSK